MQENVLTYNNVTDDESGFNVGAILSAFPPLLPIAVPLMIAANIFCKKHCISLGYENGQPLTKCKIECKKNVQAVKSGKYKIAPANQSKVEQAQKDQQAHISQLNIESQKEAQQKSKNIQTVLIISIITVVFIIAIIVIRS